MKIGIDPEDIAGYEEFENVQTGDPNLFISVGIGNRKIGLIPSWSLPNKETCSPKAFKYCGRHCYNNRIREMFPSTWETWEHNLWMYRTHPTLTEMLIRKYLYMALPSTMRLHVSGDFFSKDYLEMWKRIASDHKDTVFYGYSKMDGIDHTALPDNLRILRSTWPGMPLPRQKGVKRNCWVQDGTEKRVPKSAFRCVGDCPKCGFKCAYGSGDVVIPLHK